MMEERTMKKYIYILLSLAALLFVACIKQDGPDVDGFDDMDEDGPMVTLEFSLSPETKSAMAHDPSISTIHVAVFNKAGVLKQFEQATLTDTGSLTNGNNPSGNPKYAVDIHMSAKPRILHFIADAPITTFDDLVAAAGTSGEDVIMNALTTTGGQAAYWQRFVLDKVDAYTYQGGVYTTPGGQNWGTAGGDSYTYTDAGQTITVNKGDYIKTNGHKVLDGTGYFQSDYVRGVISNIPFVRNFAEINVTGMTGSNFVPKKFALVNVPTHGYVAPYDTEAGAFAKAYTESVTGSSFSGTLTYSGVNGTGYSGTLAGTLDTSMPTSFIDLTGSGNHNAYMYERPLPNTSQPSTCILVGGEYSETGALKDGNGLTWLLIEVDKDGSYFPIYRGLSYDMRIGTVEGTKGYASPEAAFNAEPIGDISSSVTTATLTQINDGKGTTLWVSYIDYVATWAQTKTIYYTMFYDDGGNITYLNNTVSASVSHPDPNYKAIVGDPDLSDVNIYTSGTPDDSKQWKKISVELDGSGQSTKRSVLRISGTANSGKTMYRDVNYRVIDIQHFKYGSNILSGTPLADEDSGEETTLTIWLPSDLGYSMFPLTLKIEAQNGNYTTVDALPVESGPSLFDPNKNSFYFLKTIEYNDYYNPATHVTTNMFTATFKTTRDGTTSAAGTNATLFAVQDKANANRINPYFETATCYVPVGSHAFMLSSNAVTVDAGTTHVNFKVISSSNGTWNLSATSGATVSAASGVGNEEITVTFPANTSTTDSNTYIVTASLSGFPNQTLTITQSKKDPTVTTVTFNASEFNGFTTVTKDGVSVVLDYLFEYNSQWNQLKGAWDDDYYNSLHIVQDGSLSGFSINSVQFNSDDTKFVPSESYTKGYSDSGYTTRVGSYTVSGNVGTWVGDSPSLYFLMASSSSSYSIWLDSIVVTFTSY